MAWNGNPAIDPQGIGGLNQNAMRGQAIPQNMNMNNGNYWFQQPQPPAPQMSIIRVNGQNGAEALRMAPNSEALLLDTTDAIVWLAQTDGAGYKTVTPYSVIPYRKEPQVDLNTLEQRLSRVEELLNNAKQSNTGSTSRSAKKQSNARANANEQPVDVAD